MGNTESSSEFQEDEDYSVQRTKKPSTEEDQEDRQSSTTGTVLKAGVAVAGTALMALGWRVAETALRACCLASCFTSSDSEGRSIEYSVPDGVGVGSSSDGFMAEVYQSFTSNDFGGGRKSIMNSVPDGVGVRGSSTGGYMVEAYQSSTSGDSGGKRKSIVNFVPDEVGVRGSSTGGYIAEAYQSPTSNDSEGRRKSIVNSVPHEVGVRGSSTGGYMAEAYQSHTSNDSGAYQPHRLRPSNHMGESNLYHDLRVIKIMSYNVWFREDVHVRKRMRAIGRLVLKHSPEIIFFQEVTPNIYEIFQRSSWWQAYNCSVSPEKAIKRSNFCMLLSRLSVKKFSCKHLDNSMTTKRELCIADVDVGSSKKLLVATSHFKSPTPFNMHSTERVAQARDALSFLKRSRNVVFGGDLNWVDSSDGSFPLYGKWIDAWAHLRPEESGWTFDTRSNAMLWGRKLLQTRLDRFICKLKDFKLIKIDIVGMEAIKGVLYVNERMMTLPVLPSDHYGLLLTIQSN